MNTTMRFCPECGTKLEEVFAFCPECGASLAGVFPVAEPSESQGTTIERSAANSNDTVDDTSAPPVQARGFILTNITALASRLRTNTTTIATLLTWYVENMRQMGVVYKVLDAGDYTYQKKPLFGNPKHVSLTPNDPWYAYADILKDQHDYEVKEHLPETDYLFIVGGDNVVPMPCMPNYITKFDKYFDTDLLYAYPYGADMERKLLSQEIFKYDALFYIGRLPIAEDGNLGDLQGYLERVIANGCAVEVKEAYAQCDPHWRNVTMMLTDELAQYDLFPRYVDEIPTDILYQGRLFTTPSVRVIPQTRQQYPFAFNTKANYIFFNMHGGGEKTVAGFYGKGLNAQYAEEGFAPEVLALSKVPNIVFTQACYGGKFIGYTKRYSTLLTAMSSNTLAYVGSSRVAFGAEDKEAGIYLSSSDILAKVFNYCMLQGCTAGSALFHARVQTYKNSPGCLYHALTIGEFNLYGDPLVHIRSNGEHYKQVGSKAAMLGPNDRVGVLHDETLMDKSANVQQSILQQVRSAVDKNIMDISNCLSKTLYAQYGIEARQPAVIKRITYADGHKELNFIYDLPIEAGLANSVIAITSEQGDLQTVMTTK